ncbi:MAG: YebC/PmpR family DNA-binding transcriptional regulator [Phycisphaerae bacterium]|jgi:YebC/PmpR family DNA-binding regulatory protein|nr:YebC/PmpR family DNA-binding transcriptional regulator [Phycisphaerae bacterium]MDP7636164.1 YebC/PmpR family DNA-binding transcriptional regulator [Phycisphaerae bacterium]
MSGHSKWSKIKRGKAANDAKRGRIWSKLAKRIMVAAKDGGANPAENLTLRYAIDDARSANMPNDTISNAIKKGTGEIGAQSFEHIVYEGYGPSGVAFIVECLTDNRNRTASEIRKIFERAGGHLGATNCVAWLFEQKGTFLVSAQITDEDTLMEIALESGADDVTSDDNGFQITCQVGAYSAVKQALADKEIETAAAEIGMVAKNTAAVADAGTARRVLGLMEAFEDHDDVQNVFANFDIPDEIPVEAE